MSNGRSLHIGLDAVDPAHYDGWSGDLSACVNDALDMEVLAHERGFETNRLLDEHATRDSVLSALEDNVASSAPGDILLVTFSGHGSQLPDKNRDEADLQDETWCLYDGEFLDDELWRIWVRAAEGVRIVVLSDSCHSGSILKFRADLTSAPTHHRPKHVPPTLADRVYRKHRDHYDALGSLPAPDLALLKASVLLISASLEDELAYEGVGNGEFTGALLQIWDGGAFTGDYRDLHRRIRKRVGSFQTPSFLPLGNNTGALVSQSPFSI